MPNVAKQDNLLKADFLNLVGGLNNTDSPFKVTSDQAVSGYNYDYIATGGIKKRNGHTLLNASPDSQSLTLGLYLHSTSASSKTLLRAAGTKLQTVNTSTGATTSVTDDTVSAGTTPFSTTQPVVFSPFVTSASTTWMAGGGLASGNILGYNGTNSTINGSSPAAGSITPTDAGGSGSAFANSFYGYAIVMYKANTGALSNAALDASVQPTATHNISIDLSTITAYDTTKYTQLWIYRSSAQASAAATVGFTAGTLVAKIAFNGTTYTIAAQGSGNHNTISGSTFTDTGNSDFATSQNVPRANNTILDNSVLPAGTYNTLATFKRRLVTAQGSTIYLSDLNKPESWPTQNQLVLPSGGSITALGVIYFSTPTSTATDEFLVIFKEREMWVLSGDQLTGSSSTGLNPWVLKFVDYIGCVAQPLIVSANGFIFWIDYRGIYMWDGSSKPVYLSRPIEYDFGVNGDIDRSNLTKGCGAFFRKQNEIVWFLSSLTLGVQALSIKLDLRLTLQNPFVPVALVGRVLDAVFIKDQPSSPMYACASCLPTFDETFYAGDNVGGIWKLLDNPNSDNGNAIALTYQTRPEEFGTPGVAKRFHKVIVWCRESTINNLTLNYWTTYRSDMTSEKSFSVQISPQVTNGVWDQATWDNAYWDQNLVSYTPVVFNLQGVEGDVLTLQFSQPNANAPITIIGYSVLYTLAGLRK